MPLLLCCIVLITYRLSCSAPGVLAEGLSLLGLCNWSVAQLLDRGTVSHSSECQFTVTFITACKIMPTTCVVLPADVALNCRHTAAMTPFCDSGLMLLLMRHASHSQTFGAVSGPRAAQRALLQAQSACTQVKVTGSSGKREGFIC